MVRSETHLMKKSLTKINPEQKTNKQKAKKYFMNTPLLNCQVDQHVFKTWQSTYQDKKTVKFVLIYNILIFIKLCTNFFILAAIRIY